METLNCQKIILIKFEAFNLYKHRINTYEKLFKSQIREPQRWQSCFKGKLEENSSPKDGILTRHKTS